MRKKYAHHTAFYVDHAHINSFLKLLMQYWITLRGHEPLISFFKILRSYSSLNAKNSHIKWHRNIFKKISLGSKHNIIQFVFLLQVKIHMEYMRFKASIYHVSKKSSFQRQIWPKSVTHIHGITLCLPLNELSCSQIDPRHTSYENIFPWLIRIDAPFTPNLGLEHIVYILRIMKTQPSPILRMK